MGMLRGECYRMCHNRLMLGATVLLLFLTGRLLIGARAPYNLFDMDIIIRQFLCNPVPILWIGAVLSVLSFGGHFSRRTWNGAFYAGKGRLAIVGSGIVLYYLWGLLLEFLPFVLLLSYLAFKGAEGSFLIEEVLAGLGVHVMVCLALLSIPLVISFCVRDMLWSMAVSAGHLFFLLFVMEKVAPEEGIGQILVCVHPAYQMLYRIFLPIDEAFSWSAVGVCSIYVGVGVLISLFSFWRLEWK